MLKYVHNNEIDAPSDSNTLAYAIDNEVQRLNKITIERDDPMGFMTLEMDRKNAIGAARREGIKIGEERGERLGEKRGRIEGEKQGEQKYSRLVKALIGDGRYEDLERAATDESHYRKLLQEYGIS